LAQLTSHLSDIVRCNAPLVTGLERAIADAPSLKLTQAMIALRDDLASGLRIAESMAKYPRFFPLWYVDLIAAGESTGTLVPSLDSAAEHLLQIGRFKQQAQRWIGYLGFVFIVQLSNALFLFHYIVPGFVAALADFDTEVPRGFAIIYRLSAAFVMEDVSLAVGAAGIASLAGSVSYMFFSHHGKRAFRFLRDLSAPLPFVTWFTGRMDLANICAVLQRLAVARVPLNEALRDCSMLDVNARYRAALHHVQRGIEQGQPFGEALRAERVFPKSFVTLLTLGEAAAKLPEAAGHVESMYRQQLAARGRIVCDVLGSIGVLALGFVALCVYGGIFTMMIALTDAILESMY